jgi:hypothetical protein
MKLRVIVEVDVADTIAETMQRTGFAVRQDGSAMKVQVPNTPTIPKRKTKILFQKEPLAKLEDYKAPI